MQTSNDSSSPPALEIDALAFRYPGGFELRMPRLHLARGEEMLLVGRSGCGKSTLLQLIAGLLDPSSGAIRVGSTAIHTLHGAARDRFRGRSLGMVFQTFHLLHGFSARENVLIALLMGDLPKRDADARAESLLRSLGIDRLDAPAEELSVGQQQRVAIARALVNDPVLVLADEPTGALDSRTSLEIMALFQRLNGEGRTIVVVTHEPDVAAFARRVVRFRDGKLVEDRAQAPNDAEAALKALGEERPEAA